MKVLAETRIVFRGEAPLGDQAQLEVSFDNRGEPYRRGISLTFEDQRSISHTSVFLDEREAGSLRDLIDNLYPRKK